MQLQQASRKNAKMKMAIQGPAGSGKTYSALLVAYGLCNDWSKIAVIDTENHSSELYAHLGTFQILHLGMPFSPERYIEAIRICAESSIEVIIIDSISHEWEGVGGILAIHASMTGNSYTNWAKLTPRHNAFVQCLLQTPVHVIGTIRSKQDYVLVERNGKQVPEKVGMKGITREGMDYEFTLVFELDMNNKATTTKDRTSQFIKQPAIILSTGTGNQILQWCQLGDSPDSIEKRINECKTIDELLKLFYAQPVEKAEVKQAFTKKRAELEKHATPIILINQQNNNQNGAINNASSK